MLILLTGKRGGGKKRLAPCLPLLPPERSPMTLACQYESDMERRRHHEAIQALSQKLGKPEEDVRTLYETVLCSIKEGAKIKDYLVILVSRSVRDSIEKTRFR